MLKTDPCHPHLSPWNVISFGGEDYPTSLASESVDESSQYAVRRSEEEAEELHATDNGVVEEMDTGGIDEVPK